MTVKELMDKQIFHVVNAGEDEERQVTGVFCCDLLVLLWEEHRQTAHG